MNLYLRDISQAYTKSKTPLTHNIYIKPLVEAGLLNSKMWQVMRSLYGLAEAGAHWFNTYHKHRIEKLYIVTLTFDP
jgi:hypothetical protein